MRALQVATSDRRRGAEVFAADLAAELTRRGLDAPAVALTASGEPGALRLPPLGRRPYGLATLRALRAAGAGADAVVAHGSRTLPACAVALAGAGTPFVYRSIGDPRAWSARGPRRWRTTALLRRASLVVALWPGAADALRAQHGVPADRLRVIPNGVPAARFPLVVAAARAAARERLGLRADVPVLGCLGSLTPEKRVGAVVTALGELPGVELLVAGAGPDRPALEALAARTASGRVRFLGTVDDVAGVLAACDAVVLASRTEGLPGILVEAGLSGLPAVATDVGGVAEVVVDGSTGVLVPPTDTALATKVAAGVRRALAEPGLGAAARERCLARFELGVVAAAWEELLGGLADRAPRTAGRG